MGIKGLTDIMRNAAKELPSDKKKEFASLAQLSSIKGSTLVIDFSMLAFRYGTTLMKGSLQEMSCGCICGFLRLMRQCQLLKITPIIVFDQVSPDVDAYIEVYNAITSLSKRGEISKELNVDAPMILQ